MLTLGVSAMSYDLHAKLADEFDGKTNWGYRAVDTLVSHSRITIRRHTARYAEAHLVNRL